MNMGKVLQIVVLFVDPFYSQFDHFTLSQQTWGRVGSGCLKFPLSFNFF